MSQKPIDCPPKAFCALMIPIQYTFTAQLINKTTSCGSLIYQAITDQTMVDGNRTEITVADHASRLCKDVRPFMTEITVNETGYNRMERQQFYFTHYFGANGLKSLR